MSQANVRDLDLHPCEKTSRDTKLDYIPYNHTSQDTTPKKKKEKKRKKKEKSLKILSIMRLQVLNKKKNNVNGAFK